MTIVVLLARQRLIASKTSIREVGSRAEVASSTSASQLLHYTSCNGNVPSIRTGGFRTFARAIAKRCF